MDSTLNNKLIAGLDDELSSLRRELGVNPSDPPASIKRFRARPATIYRLASWRHLAFVGSLLAASIGVAWWWSPSAHTAMMAPSAPAHLTQAAPKDGAPTAVALSSDLAQQLQPMTRDLAALRQAVEQLKVRQEQLVRDNENIASQLKASQEEMARNNSIIDQIKATQIQMPRESQTLTERLNASEERGPRHRQRFRAKGEPRRAKGDARNTTAASAAVGQCRPDAKAGADLGAAASQKAATAIGMAVVSALMP